MSGCSVGILDAQVGKNQSQVGIFEPQVGKIVVQVGIANNHPNVDKFRVNFTLQKKKYARVFSCVPLPIL